jgi:predicted DNA-binding transcriptional regulator AlpA
MELAKTPIEQERPLATAKPWLACGISRAQWFKLSASGRTPLPIRLGTRRPVYLIAELEAWLQAGAPDRATWLKLRRPTAADSEPEVIR